MTRPSRLADEVVDGWIETHPRWRREGGHLLLEVKLRDYATGAEVIRAQVALAELLDHHPIVTFGYRELRFELWTHDRDGITELDLSYGEGLDELLRGFADAIVG